MDYLDLDLELGLESNCAYPVSLRSPAGEARALVTLPSPAVQLQEHFRIAHRHARDARRHVAPAGSLPTNAPSLMELGRALFEAVFTSQVATRYAVTREQARHQRKGVRIRLRLIAPELALVPWELLFDPAEDDYVALSANTLLVRYPEVPQTIQTLSVPPPLRVLGMVASPLNLPALNVEQERQRIETALAPLIRQGRVELEWAPGGTYDDLQQTLWRGPWHVFHFIGHGAYDAQQREGELALTDPDGQAHRLSARELSRLLGDTQVRLVVLNACESAASEAENGLSSTAATLIRRGIPAAVAMQYPISDSAAIQFATTFYQAVAQHQAVDEAICAARKRLSAAGHSDWATPVLFLRAPDGVLFPLPTLRSPESSGSPISSPPLLPPPLSVDCNLVGRADLLAALKTRVCVPSARLALHGPPGVGKTAVAIQVAQDDAVRGHFVDGVIWLPLGRNADTLTLLGRWCCALGLSTSELGSLPTEETRQDYIRARLDSRHMLIVIDDAWDITSALACAAGGPNCTWLLTTRSRELAAAFATTIDDPVGILSDDESLALLAHHFPAITTLGPKVSRTLLAHANGLPLALFLLGKRLQYEARSGQPKRLTEAIDQLLWPQQLLGLRRHLSSSERHPSIPYEAAPSLSDIIALSVDAIVDTSRRALHMLAAIDPSPNTFSADAAQCISNASASQLYELSDLGLLQNGGAGRYQILHPIHDYLRFSNYNSQDEYAHVRLVEYYTAYLVLHQYNHTAIDNDLGNMMLALNIASTRGMSNEIIKVAPAMFYCLSTRGLYDQASAQLIRAQQAADHEQDATAITMILIRRGVLALTLGKYHDADQCLRQALSIAQESDDYANMSTALLNLGALSMNQKANGLAQGYLQDALAISIRIIQCENRIHALSNLGAIAIDDGQYDRARNWLKEALVFSEETGHREEAVGAIVNLGILALGHNQFEKAREYFGKALVLAKVIGHRGNIAYLQWRLGDVARAARQMEAAQFWLQSGLKIASELGHEKLVCRVLLSLSEVELECGTSDRAVEGFAEALRIADAVGDCELGGCAHFGLGRAYAQQDHIRGARIHGQRSESHFRQIGDSRARLVHRWLQNLPAADAPSARAGVP